MEVAEHRLMASSNEAHPQQKHIEGYYLAEQRLSAVTNEFCIQYAH